MQKFNYQCVNCDAEFIGSTIKYLCPHCDVQNGPGLPLKGVLRVNYNYHELIGQGKSLWNTLLNNQFLPLLPITNRNSFPQLRIGHSPVYNITSSIDMGKATVYVKDDSQNPTFSFKDRASALVSAYAKENNISTIIAASTGNAGSSLAGICASQGQSAIIVVPESAPLAKLVQIRMYGAKLVPVMGTYDDAYNLSINISDETGWYNRNTAYNPFTIEGKKTVAFEIAQQFKFELPDFIFVPVGDGVILSSVFKGFEELLMLNLIQKIPVIVAVQASGSNNLIKNITEKNFQFNTSNTIADSIAVDIPRNFFMAQQYMNKYQGQSIEVADNEIIEASMLLACKTGLFTEPAAAAAIAGFMKFNKEQDLLQGKTSLVLLTGSGLKDLASVNQVFSKIESVPCDIISVKKLLHF